MASRKNAHHTHYILRFHPATKAGKPPVTGARLYYFSDASESYHQRDFTTADSKVTRISCQWDYTYVFLPKRPEAGESSYSRTEESGGKVREIYENRVGINTPGMINVEIVVTITRKRYGANKKNSSGYFYVAAVKAEYFAVGYKKVKWELVPCEGKRVRICNPCSEYGNSAGPAIWDYLH